MSNFIKSILLKMIQFIYLFFSYDIYTSIATKKDLLYSLWLRNCFGYCGENFIIKRTARIKGGKYISIGNDFNGMKDIRFECWDLFMNQKFKPSLIIGEKVVMNNNIHIGCIDNIKIGNNVLLASNVYITDHQHGSASDLDFDTSPALRPLTSKGPVMIDDNVWIGENVSIMPNVTIGRGCIIGANSVVTKSFPEYSVLVGAPAKIIKIIKPKKNDE